MEIDLPPSGLANVAYPDVFPTPPCPLGAEDSIVDTISDGSSHYHSITDQPAEPDLEKIWSYYLSELAVRKIANRIMNCFYKENERHWLTMPLDRMIRVANELELQVTQWWAVHRSSFQLL